MMSLDKRNLKYVFKTSNIYRNTKSHRRETSPDLRTITVAAVATRAAATRVVTTATREEEGGAAVAAAATRNTRRTRKSTGETETTTTARSHRRAQKTSSVPSVLPLAVATAATGLPVTTKSSQVSICSPIV